MKEKQNRGPIRVPTKQKTQNELLHVKRIMGMEEDKVMEFLKEAMKSLSEAQFYKYDTRQRGMILGLL